MSAFEVSVAFQTDKTPADYDLLGAQHAENGEFRDDKLAQLQTAQHLRRAIAIARRFARPSREDYLICSRGFPLQRSRPPLTVAAWSPRNIRLAAERADRWNTQGGYGLSAEEGLRAAAAQVAVLEAASDRHVIRSFLHGYRWVAETPFASVDAFSGNVTAPEFSTVLITTLRTPVGSASACVAFRSLRVS